MKSSVDPKYRYFILHQPKGLFARTTDIPLIIWSSSLKLALEEATLKGLRRHWLIKKIEIEGIIETTEKDNYIWNLFYLKMHTIHGKIHNKYWWVKSIV